jgi:DNA-binding CsgD family transcriptional regulator
MYDMSSDELAHTAQEVDKICSNFLKPREFTCFQFKRNYKDGSFVVLANRTDFFQDLIEKDLTDPSLPLCFYIRQSCIYFWDESLPIDQLFSIRENKGIYHGLTIISRRKDFYDCTTFAMGKCHPSPFAYYFHTLKELKKFAELFPTMARTLIEKAMENPSKPPISGHSASRKNFFLPKRSNRFRIGEGAKDYITTYEALCVQLLQEGKSYKEIGVILSMAPSTVETHLKRLKTRTGLTLQELSLQSFHKYNRSAA